MIHRHDDGIAETGERFAAVTETIAGPRGISAAVDREKDRPLDAVLQGRSPDVEMEAVLAHTAV
jgi:hypothetical protein